MRGPFTIWIWPMDAMAYVYHALPAAGVIVHERKVIAYFIHLVTRPSVIFYGRQSYEPNQMKIK